MCGGGGRPETNPLIKSRTTLNGVIHTICSFRDTIAVYNTAHASSSVPCMLARDSVPAKGGGLLPHMSATLNRWTRDMEAFRSMSTLENLKKSKKIQKLKNFLPKLQTVSRDRPGRSRRGRVGGGGGEWVQRTLLSFTRRSLKRCFEDHSATARRGPQDHRNQRTNREENQTRRAVTGPTDHPPRTYPTNRRSLRVE